MGFEPTISAGEQLKTYALDRTATGTGNRRVAECYLDPVAGFYERGDELTFVHKMLIIF